MIDTAATNDKELRAKARWSILRRALLSPSSSSAHYDDADLHNVNDDSVGDGEVQQQYVQRHRQIHQHSMNAFPGFQVLERTVLPPPTRFLPTIAANNGAADCNENAEHAVVGAAGEGYYNTSWDTVQYKYSSRASSTTSFSPTEIKLLTRETKNMLPTTKSTTIRDRIEGLLSHRIHNGVDNTGNVRVWDAEMTLAGFLLDIVSRMDEDDDAGGIREENTGLSYLRNQLRSMMCTRACPSYVDDDEEEERVGKGYSATTTTAISKPTTTATVCNILELGAGQAGLAGLAMMVVASSHSQFVSSHDKEVSRMKPSRVILTDGHPKCIENNKICVDLTKKMMNEYGLNDGTNALTTKTQSAATTSNVAVKVECNMLLWDSSSNGAIKCRQINNFADDNFRDGTEIIEDAQSAVDEGMYHLCLASDCVHFQEFHDGLFTTIARTLTMGGIALLCQPKRGTSLNNFIELIDAVNNNAGPISDEASALGSKLPLFQVTLYDEFHPKVSAMHNALMMADCCTNDTGARFSPSSNPNSNSTEKDEFIQCWSKCYDPNLHLPLLLVLRKLRRYDEDTDGELARRHVKNRVAV